MKSTILLICLALAVTLVAGSSTRIGKQCRNPGKRLLASEFFERKVTGYFMNVTSPIGCIQVVDTDQWVQNNGIFDIKSGGLEQNFVQFDIIGQPQMFNGETISLRVDIFNYPQFLCRHEL